MKEWVRTDDLARLIERRLEGTLGEYAPRIGLSSRMLHKIIRRDTTNTSVVVADRVCLGLGLNLGVDIETYFAQPNGGFTSLTGLQANRRRYDLHRETESRLQAVRP